MIRVAIETATPAGSVAVAREERVLTEVSLGIQTRHAETALPALETALRLAGVERSRVEEVVVGAGPGSFTGVRVAAAMAKGLVRALDVPLRAYSSLLGLAAGVPADRPVCALFDARRGEVYAGCWSMGRDGIRERLAPRVGPVEAVVEALAVQRGGADRGDGSQGGEGGRAGEGRQGLQRAPLFVGEGAGRYRDVLESSGAVVSAVPAVPRASTLLWLAAWHPEAGTVEDAAGWEPTYLRASSAERGVAG